MNSLRGAASPLEAAKKQLRAQVGLWPLREMANRVRLGPAVPGLRRFEDAEVNRLALRGPRRTALVATVIPTHRRPELLLRAVESALAQSVTDHEVIVVDDGGGLPPLPAHPALHTVSLARNTAVLGLVRNVGIRLTESRFLAFLDDDNFWRPDHLEVALATLGAGASVVYTAVQRQLPDGTVLDVLSTPFDRTRLRDGPAYVDANSLVVRRDRSVRFSRLPRTRATMPKEDWEFVHRMSRSRVTTHVPEPTVRYLVNPDSYYTSWTPP